MKLHFISSIKNRYTIYLLLLSHKTKTQRHQSNSACYNIEGVSLNCDRYSWQKILHALHLLYMHNVQIQVFIINTFKLVLIKPMVASL